MESKLTSSDRRLLKSHVSVSLDGFMFALRALAVGNLCSSLSWGTELTGK